MYEEANLLNLCSKDTRFIGKIPESPRPRAKGSYLFYSISLLSHAAAMHSISTRVSPPKLMPTAVRAGLFIGKNSA